MTGEEFEVKSGEAERNFNSQADQVLEQLRVFLQNIYADLNVSREKVNAVVQEGRALAQDQRLWRKGPEEAEEFLAVVGKLERKINQTLDLKKMKEMGLVKAVKF